MAWPSWVPGLQVARIDGNKWAISSRGFNNTFANKMLVVIDGRSVYTPLLPGVYFSLPASVVPVHNHSRQPA